MPKIHVLPGTESTPLLLLNMAIDAIENGDCDQAIVVLNNDQGVDHWWSSMPIETLVYMHRMLGIEIDRVARGEA